MLHFIALFYLSFLCYYPCCALVLPNDHLPSKLSIRESRESLACRSNITLPSVPEQCSSQCASLHVVQSQCSDILTCMCTRAPAVSITNCFDCTIDAARGFTFDITSEFANKTRSLISSYDRACNFLYTQSGPRSQDTYLSQSCASVSLSAHDFSTYPHHYSIFHNIIPYASFVIALIFACLKVAYTSRGRCL
ncbi:hypothetical protein BDQ17DRAFT_1379930 [Cyathus striatus]|nr:hypothetical protein BDQ17DRAFT_1379930 [Cyathus striatus]